MRKCYGATKIFFFRNGWVHLYAVKMFKDFVQNRKREYKIKATANPVAGFCDTINHTNVICYSFIVIFGLLPFAFNFNCLRIK